MTTFFRHFARIMGCVALGSLMLLSGCKNSSTNGISESEDVLLHQAKKQLQDQKHQAAIEPLTHLSNNFQISSNAQAYKLELMHAQYRAKEYMKAIETADQYISTYPFEAQVDYAMYIKVLASHDEFNSRHWMPKSIRESYAYTDTKIIDEALVAARSLQVSHPKSIYSGEVAMLASEMKEIIMKKHYHIAKEYRTRKAYAASQRRLTNVIVSTDSRELLHKALHMMKDNHISMNQPDDAAKVEELIQVNWSNKAKKKIKDPQPKAKNEAKAKT